MKNGHSLWRRSCPDKERFAFWQFGKWVITGTQWYDAMTNAKTCAPIKGFVSSKNIVDAFWETEWEEMT